VVDELVISPLYEAAAHALREADMDDKKPSTADILAKIRAQKAAAAGGAGDAAPSAPAPDAAPAAAAPATPVEATPAAPATPAAKPAAPGAKPGSTKDILAAIRAQGGKGAAPAASAAAPAAAEAAKPAAAKAAPPPASMSIADMVRAAKAGAPAAPAAAADKPKVALPPMPQKPVVAAKPGAAKKGQPDPSRRSLSQVLGVGAISLACFVLGAVVGSPLLAGIGVAVWATLMTPFAIAWASIGAVTGISTLGVARFMFPNVLVEPPSKFKIGPASDYPLNSVSNKWKDQFAIWIVHTDQYEGKSLIYALSTVCTHLGCTPSWLDGEQKFKCPCHGSGFYITGVNFEGPAPRPLERVGLRVAEDGQLEVDKSLKFQEEMGQWTDPASYVEA
jgi:cytochrome b6-f complex iron-sulfur subunit